jgi:hypothetical protein
MLNFRRCWDAYDAMDDGLQIEMKEAIKHGDLDRHGKLIMKRATLIKERLALLKEYEAEQEAKKLRLLGSKAKPKNDIS